MKSVNTDSLAAARPGPLLAVAAQGLPEHVDALGRARAFAEPLLAGEQLDTGESTWLHAQAVAAILATMGGSEAMQAAKKHGAVTSLDLNFREKLWRAQGGVDRAPTYAANDYTDLGALEAIGQQKQGLGQNELNDAVKLSRGEDAPLVPLSPGGGDVKGFATLGDGLGRVVGGGCVVGLECSFDLGEFFGGGFLLFLARQHQRGFEIGEPGRHHEIIGGNLQPQRPAVGRQVRLHPQRGRRRRHHNRGSPRSGRRCSFLSSSVAA